MTAHHLGLAELLLLRLCVRRMGMLAAHGPYQRDIRSGDLGLFRAAARTARNCTAFGPFRFARVQYDEALRALRSG